ncbi:DUF1800 domain-containing protein [Maribacter sp. 2307ULW6-5]|uniref:DUF1800 domain-containing protein n=1 Tax=Maribacter sp. 2307ULW6-5 TaxID=3386275 RepID=UPI0039BCFBA9
MIKHLTPMSTNCNSSSLNVYGADRPWTADEVRHLYRRAAFGISTEDISVVLTKTPAQAVDDLVDAALNTPLSIEPVGSYTKSEKLGRMRHTYLSAMKSNGLRDRLTLFWSNHFVTEYNVYNCLSYLHEYVNILQRQALGNVKTFVHEIGLCSAMLVYLNGNENKKDGPNENYARELFELFTLGEGIGYTQSDIENTAKALTGYTSYYNYAGPDNCLPITFVENDFNTEQKTIFGRTGNWNYDDVIDILFEERSNEIATFIVQKIYRYFVHPMLPDESIINELASDLLNADFELEPVLRKLFKSEHFFDVDARWVIIKSPVDLVLGFLNDCNIPYPDIEDGLSSRVFKAIGDMGQLVFDPPNVAGWQGDKTWINSKTLLDRWRGLEILLIRLPIAFGEHLFTDFVNSLVEDPNESDVELVMRKVVEALLPSELLTDLDYENALERFKSSLPQNYFEDGTWSLTFHRMRKQTYDLLFHITKQPEFQLK